MICLFFIPVNETNAFEYIFNDDFTFRNDSIWTYNENGGIINYNNGVLTLDSNSSSFPYLYGKGNKIFSNIENSVLLVRYKYNSSGGMGAGIGIGYTGAFLYPFYQMSLWRDSGAYFIYNDFNKAKYSYCKPSIIGIDEIDRIIKSIPIDNDWHILRIERINTYYKIYIDKNLYPTPIYEMWGTQCLPTNILLGNPLSGGGNDWNSISFDYVKSFVGSDPPEPTPVPLQKHKIIFIPGMGASWNTKALVYNDTVPDNEWKMTPFVNNYDNLINSFEKNGLVKGSDFYVWNYDWRKPLGESVGKLSSFISSSVASNETVDLIGHSMGGMIARLWAQDNVNDQRLGKIISLGSPQHGAVDAYSVWESAQIAERIDPASVALSIMIGLQQRGGESRVQTLRNYSPSFKDLLPTFNFAKSGGLIKDVEEMSTVNDYLLSKNLSSPSIFDKYLAVVGQGSLTKEWVNLGDRDYLDKYLGQWSDGKVISYDYSDDGDGTVLIKSGQFVGDTMVVKLSNHGNLVNNSLSLILNELDIGDSLVVDTGESNLSGKLIFLIASPARMDVICDDGFTTTNDEHGLISFDSLGKNECQLTITGFADGTYHLVTGKIGEKNSYRYWENSIISGGIHRMLINPTDGEPILGANDDYWYGLLKLKSNQLLDLFNEDKDLVMAIKFIESRDIAKFMGKFFSFWKNHHEMIVSNQIIDIIREILISNQHQVNKGVAKKYWREIELRTERFSKFVDKADKNQGITNFEIGIYQKVSDLLDDGKQKLNNENYDNVWADIVLVKELLKQINN